VLNRPQIVTDAYLPYEAAVSEAFGGSVDYVMLNKKAGGYPIQRGHPDLSRATTNHVERANLTIRMHLCRCSRRTNAHSKKIGPHRAAIALHIAFYNWCRVHETLRVTPAMELGLTDHVWSITELMRESLATPIDVPPLDQPHPFPRPDRQPFKLRVIRGGKIARSYGKPEISGWSPPPTERAFGIIGAPLESASLHLRGTRWKIVRLVHEQVPT
jgi:hypothetical protein